jgi:hypothetical protein
MESIGVEQTATPELMQSWVSAALFANVAIFVPFVVTVPIVVTKLWLYNGTVGVTSSTYQLGIYSEDGTRIVATSSTDQVNAIDLGLEVTDITDTKIGPGNFYMAIAASATSITVGSTTIVAAQGQLLGLREQTGLTGSTLTNPATFAAYGRTVNPAIGFLVGPRSAL